MILITLFALALMVALARGGSLARLSALSVQFAWLAPLALALQLYIVYIPEPKAEGLLSGRSLLLTASYVLLVAFVWKNRRLPGMWLIGAGLLANFAVMVANGGYMPITPEALAASGHLNNAASLEAGARVYRTKDIILPRDATNLWFLSDLMVLPLPAPIATAFSIGDALIGAGIFWLIQRAMGQSTTRAVAQEI